MNETFLFTLQRTYKYLNIFDIHLNESVCGYFKSNDCFKFASSNMNLGRDDRNYVA